jgi:hypothetical protein
MDTGNSVPSPKDIFKWWEWALSIQDLASAPHPGNGGDADQNQPASFFCYVCTFGTGSDLKRIHKVKEKDIQKRIMIPVLTSEASKAENPSFDDEQLLNKAREDLLNPEGLFLNVDGVPILTPKNANHFYVESAAGSVTPAMNNILGLPNIETRMRCIGYFVLLNAFESGLHEVSFGGSAGPVGDRYETNIRYQVSVP